MKKFRKRHILKVMIVFFMITPVFFIKCYASSNIDLDFNKNTKISWEISELDRNLIDKVKTQFNFSLYCLKNSDKGEGFTITHRIEDIKETSNKWKVIISFTNSENSNKKLKRLTIYKNSSKIPEDWYYEINDLKLSYIPVDADDYLDKIVEKSPIMNNTDIKKGSKYQILIERSFYNESLVAEITYDSNGILFTFKLKINDDVAFHYKCTGVSKNTANYSWLIGLIISIIIIIIFLIFIPIYIISKTIKSVSKKKNVEKSTADRMDISSIVDMKNRENKKLIEEHTLISGVENSDIMITEKNKREIYEKYEFFENDDILKDYKKQYEVDELKSPLKIESFCTLCGSKRIKEGNFCYYCGNKFKRLQEKELY